MLKYGIYIIGKQLMTLHNGYAQIWYCTVGKQLMTLHYWYAQIWYCTIGKQLMTHCMKKLLALMKNIPVSIVFIFFYIVGIHMVILLHPNRIGPGSNKIRAII